MRGSSQELGRLLGVLFDTGSTTGHSDAELLARLQLGGSSGDLAFQAIVERHGPMVLRVCRRVLRDPHEANDAFQATFLVLARRAASIRNPDALASWLHGVGLRAAGTLRAAAARRRRHERRAAEERNEWFEPSDAFDGDLNGTLHHEIGRLPERERLVMVLCDLEGRTYQEAASQMGCPIGTVKSRLSTARTRLRSRLVRKGIAPAGVWAVALTELSEAAPAPITWSLKQRTLQSAADFAASRARATPGMVPGNAQVLAHRMIQAMAMTKLKSLSLACGAFVATATLAWAQFGGAGTQASTNADDRLDALENKLDRLIQALERQSGAPGAAEAHKSVTFRAVTTPDSTTRRATATATATNATSSTTSADGTVTTQVTTDDGQTRTVRIYTTRPDAASGKATITATVDDTDKLTEKGLKTITIEGKPLTVSGVPAQVTVVGHELPNDRVTQLEAQVQALSKRIDVLEKKVLGNVTTSTTETTPNHLATLKRVLTADGLKSRVVNLEGKAIVLDGKPAEAGKPHIINIAPTGEKTLKNDIILLRNDQVSSDGKPETHEMKFRVDEERVSPNQVEVRGTVVTDEVRGEEK